MKKEYVEYTHHNTKVIVRADLRGKHRDHCLCYDCLKFIGESDDGSELIVKCAIAQDVYANCVNHNIVSPVWECPNFVLTPPLGDCGE